MLVLIAGIALNRSLAGYVLAFLLFRTLRWLPLCGDHSGETFVDDAHRAGGYCAADEAYDDAAPDSHVSHESVGLSFP